MSYFDSSASLSYQGLSIDCERSTGLICITDLWQAQSSPASQRPLAWVRQEATQNILRRLVQQVNAEPLWSQRQQFGQHFIVGVPRILETIAEDGDLRTYTTINLTIEYAHFLAPRCHEWALANLTPGSAPVAQSLVPQSHAELPKRRKTFSRRTALVAGWSLPVVSVLLLNQQRAAAVSAGRSTTQNNTPSINTISDPNTKVINQNNGTTEITRTDGSKEITEKDGTKRVIEPNK